MPRISDQLHTLHADWSYHPTNNRWRLAIAALWHSGTPYTPDVVTFDTLVNTATQFSLHST